MSRTRDRLGILSGIARVAAPRGIPIALRAAVDGMRADEPQDAVEVPMKALNGDSLFVRPGTSDLSSAIAYYSKAIYMPAPEIRDAACIVELGTNCGVALTALGYAFAEARLVGVEADAVNVEAARRNTARFGERCEVVEGAIWDESAELVVVPSEEHGSHGVSVRTSTPDDPPAWSRLNGMTIDALLGSRLDPGETVDYMHISIEGSEPRVFAAGGEWPARVRSIRVELHPYFGFRAGDCIAALESLGYSAREAPDPPDKWVYAVR